MLEAHFKKEVVLGWRKCVWVCVAGSEREKQGREEGQGPKKLISVTSIKKKTPVPLRSRLFLNCLLFTLKKKNNNVKLFICLVSRLFALHLFCLLQSIKQVQELSNQTGSSLLLCLLLSCLLSCLCPARLLVEDIHLSAPGWKEEEK